MNCAGQNHIKEWIIEPKGTVKDTIWGVTDKWHKSKWTTGSRINAQVNDRKVLKIKAGFRMVATISVIAEKKTLSNRCNHIETTLQRSLWNDVSATIAEVWYPYDHNDCWTFFPAIAVIIAMIWKPALMVLMMSETFLLWFIKSWAVLLSRWSRGWGICLLFWSHPGAFDGLIYPTPGNLPFFLKKY